MSTSSQTPGRKVSGARSETEKEKTKMRERQRRAITTKIFHGLRKHGGYNLSPRADINEVLRHLASEAGWVVHPDGTTYRFPKGANPNSCPVCGSKRTSATPTPSSSVVIPSGACGGGESSTSASPRQGFDGDALISIAGVSASPSTYLAGGSSSAGENGNIPMTFYVYGGVDAGSGFHQQQQMYLQEARTSTQNTPMGSPLRRL